MQCKLKYVVIITTFLVNYLSLGMSYAMPAVFYTYWLEKYGNDAGWTSLVSSINLGLLAAFGVIASYLTQKFGYRVTVGAGAVISTIGLLLTCYAEAYHTLMIGYGILTGIGWGILYTPGMSAIVFYFKPKYHGLLLGLTTSGAGLAVSVSPVLLGFLIETFGSQGALLLQAGFNVHTFVCAAVLRPCASMSTVKRSGCGEQTIIFKDWRFLNLCFQQFFYSLGLSVVFVHLAYSAETVLQISRAKSVIIVSAAGIASTISRLFVGALTKLPCVNVIVQYALQCGMTGVAVLAIPFTGSYGLMIFVAVCIGVGYSVYGPVLAVVVCEFVGSKNLTAGWGGVNVSCGLGLGLGAPIAGFLFDRTKDYNNSLYFGSAVMIFSMFAIAPTFFGSKLDYIHSDIEEKSGQNNGDQDVVA